MTSKNKTTKPEKPNVPFEQAMERLESIVAELEDGSLSLDKSLEYFEEGMLLAKSCESTLSSATGRVEKIMKDFSGNEKAVLIDTSFTESGDDNDF